MLQIASEVYFPSASDVLLNSAYDPNEHLLDNRGKSNIAHIPDHTDFLLRWYPYDKQSAEQVRRTFQSEPDASTLEDLQDRHTEQIALLRGQNIQVVEHKSEVLPIQTSTWNGLSIVTTVKRLQSEPLGAESPQGRDMPSRLLGYLAASYDSAFIMPDVFKPAQFGVSVESSDANTEPILLDIEPRLAPASMRSLILSNQMFISWHKQATGRSWRDQTPHEPLPLVV